MRYSRLFAGLSVLGVLASVTVSGHAAPGASLAQAPAKPAPGQPPSAPPASTQASLTQPLAIVAGTGVLLQLPQAAATVLSADPTIARVQPASPTSLFVMGVAPGRTTVVATNQAGAAIVQYDISVAAGAGRPVAALSGGAVATPGGTVSAATALAVQSSIASSVSGAQQVRTRAAGNDL